MRVLITGITGTLGKTLLKICQNDTEVKEVIGLSRDEQKQRELMNEPKLRLMLGDIRDRHTCIKAVGQVDGVLHCAALKCVDTLEFAPDEAYKTNVVGTDNLIWAAGFFGCKNFVMASTDKAVEPINAYGNTKALAEKIVLNSGYSVVRYGNVLGSRGSVLPLFKKHLEDKKTVYITDPSMTRFWIKIEDAAKFIYEVFKNPNGSVNIPPLKAASVLDVADVVADCLGVEDFEKVMTGIRPGEKLHESIDIGVTSKNSERFTRTELKELIKPVLENL